MTRNLKILGLALVAAFALSAVAASGASASAALFTSGVAGGETAKITGGQGAEGAAADTFTIGGNALTCTTATETGTAVTAGTSSTYVKLTPTYTTCHVVVLFVTRTVTVTMNSCHYTFNATKNTNSAPAPAPTPGVATPFSADLHITCTTPGDKIEVHVYNTSNHNDAGAATSCTFDIFPQTILNQIQLTNIPAPVGGKDDIVEHIHMNIALHNTILGGFCPPNTFETFVYKGTHTLRAFAPFGAQVNATVS